LTTALTPGKGQAHFHADDTPGEPLPKNIETVHRVRTRYAGLPKQTEILFNEMNCLRSFAVMWRPLGCSWTQDPCHKPAGRTCFGV
jgi:hypothetical protein